MFKSLFFAVGIFLLIFGAQTLVVDKWIMSYESPATAQRQNSQRFGRTPFRAANYSPGNSGYYGAARNVSKPVYQTQEWMPWSLLAAGTIIVLYSISTRHSESGD